jgi:hypothetical protein
MAAALAPSGTLGLSVGGAVVDGDSYLHVLQTAQFGSFQFKILLLELLKIGPFYQSLKLLCFVFFISTCCTGAFYCPFNSPRIFILQILHLLSL